MVKTEAAAALLALVQGCAERAGFLLEDAPMTGGGSDASFTSAMGVPTLDGLGADGDGAHTLHEYILVSTLEQRLKFWELLLKEWVESPALRASPGAPLKRACWRTGGAGSAASGLGEI